MQPFNQPLNHRIKKALHYSSILKAFKMCIEINIKNYRRFSFIKNCFLLKKYGRKKKINVFRNITEQNKPT